MRRFFRRDFIQDKRGVAAIEFAFAAPCVLLALFGLVGVGVYYFQSDQVNEALRLASRDVTVSRLTTQNEIRTAFKNQLEERGYAAEALEVLIVEDAQGNVAQINYDWTVDLRIPLVDPQLLTRSNSIEIPL